MPNLQDIAQLIQLANQNSGEQPIETANIGGRNILVNRKNNGTNQGLSALGSLAGGFDTGRQLQKRNQFLQGVQQISQSQGNPDEKINSLVGLMAQHGTDYGLGINDIIQQYGQLSKNNTILNKPTASMGISTRQDAIDTAQGIMSGVLPPDQSTFSFRDRTVGMAEMARNKFNLSDANNEWKATQKFLSSMNSEKQVRLRQAITSVREALTGLSQLNNEVGKSELAPLNSAQLTIRANSGDPLAVKYLGQINIIRDELAQVFMGGNSPTDKALDLASQTLKGNWSNKQLQSAIDNINTNLQYRENAINFANVQGTKGRGGTRYSPMQTTPEKSGKQLNTQQDKYQIGQTISKNGKTYKYIGNNQWSY